MLREIRMFIYSRNVRYSWGVYVFTHFDFVFQNSCPRRYFLWHGRWEYSQFKAWSENGEWERYSKHVATLWCKKASNLCIVSKCKKYLMHKLNFQYKLLHFSKQTFFNVYYKKKFFLDFFNYTDYIQLNKHLRHHWWNQSIYLIEYRITLNTSMEEMHWIIIFQV